MLLFLEDFRPQLEDRRVVSGMTVFFTCLTNEQPQVRVEWLHNGKRIDPLTAPSHMTFKADNQILVINEVFSIFYCFIVFYNFFSLVSAALVA